MNVFRKVRVFLLRAKGRLRGGDEVKRTSPFKSLTRPFMGLMWAFKGLIRQPKTAPREPKRFAREPQDSNIDGTVPSPWIQMHVFLFLAK